MNVKHRGSSYKFVPMNNADNFITKLSPSKVKIVSSLLQRVRPLSSKFGALKVHIHPLELVKAILMECAFQNIPVHDVCLIGGAASFVVAAEDFQPVGFNDIDINIYTTANKEQFEVIRTIVFKCFYEKFIKPALKGSSSTGISGVSLSNTNNVNAGEMAPNHSMSLVDNSEGINNPILTGNISDTNIKATRNNEDNHSITSSIPNTFNSPKTSYSLPITSIPITNSIYSMRTSSQCKMCENYLSKLLIVHNNDELWSLYGFGNNSDQILDIKFVSKLRRHYEFSVDSFQIDIMPLLKVDGECIINGGKANITSSDLIHIVSDELLLNNDLNKSHNRNNDQLNNDFSNLTVSDTDIYLPLYCKYYDYDQALYHLKHRIIMTDNVDEIFGGGLLKYCYLLAKHFTPDPNFFTIDIEAQMCTKFFKDLPPKQTFTDKINFYIFFHFVNHPLTLKRNFLVQLHRILHLSCDFIDNYRWMVALETVRRMISDIDFTLNPPHYCKYPHGSYIHSNPSVHLTLPQTNPNGINNANRVNYSMYNGVPFSPVQLPNVSTMPPPQLFPPPPHFFSMMLFNNYSSNNLSPRSKRRFFRRRFRSKNPNDSKFCDVSHSNTINSTSATTQTVPLATDNDEVVYEDDEDASSASANSITHGNHSVSVHTSSECIDYQTKN